MKRTIIATLALAGCAQGPAPTTNPVASAPPASNAPVGSACDVAALADLVGRTADAGLQDEAQRRARAGAVRVVGPDTAVTMDFRPDRLNILVDGKGMVTAFRCY